MVIRFWNIRCEFCHPAGDVRLPVMHRNRQFAFGFYLDTRLQPFLALPVEAEEAHPLVFEILIDLLGAERREHRIGLILFVLPFLDVLAHLAAKQKFALDGIGNFRRRQLEQR